MCLFVCSKEWCFHSCTTHIQTTLSLLVTAVPVTVSYRCTNSGHQFTQVTKFCVVVPYVCGASMRNMFDVTLLPPEILRRLLNFLKNLCKSSVSNKIFSSNRLYRWLMCQINMVDNLGRFCNFEDGCWAGVGWGFNSSGVWCRAAGVLWRVRGTRSFVFRDNQIFLGLLVLEDEGSSCLDHCKRSPDDMTSHDRDLGSSAVRPWEPQFLFSLYCFLSVQYLNYISVFQLIALN